MPVGDWQFWVVTLVCLLAIFGVVRNMRSKRKGACGGCRPAGGKPARRVRLTVDGERPEAS